MKYVLDMILDKLNKYSENYSQNIKMLSILFEILINLYLLTLD